MPSFAYAARDGAGASVSGTIVAETTADVSRQLRGEGKYPVSITPAPTVSATADGAVKSTAQGLKVSRARVVQFVNELAIMIETGVPVAEALDSIAQQADDPKMRQLVGDLSANVKVGVDFSSALQRHPRSFPRVFVAMIKASEKSGKLTELLHRANEYMRDENETVRKVRGALMYPCIMLSFAILTTIFLLAFVMPRFTTIYATKGAALPVPTRVLMTFSNAIVSHWVLMLIVLAGTVGGAWMYLRTPAGVAMFHAVILRLPLLGPVFCKLYLSRALRMMGTMTGAGVNLVESVNITGELTANTSYRRLWQNVGEQIQAGRQFSEPLAASRLVPKPVTQMIRSGEKSGRLGQVMQQVAIYSEKELKERITELTKYVEPAMIIIMGAIIGTVTLALLLPIFTISKVMAQ